MATLPRVDSITWERVSREFDDRGPEVCRTEITRELEVNNPEILDMAKRCARDVGDFNRIMTGFCMFYRLLAAEARAGMNASERLGAHHSTSMLPRVSPMTRASVAERIERIGSTEFTRNTIAALEHNNPELLRMGHSFAENHADYAGVIQGFALLYACLLAEDAQQRGALH
jgi:hypothetical protein